MLKVPYEEPPISKDWALTEYINRMFMQVTNSINRELDPVVVGLRSSIEIPGTAKTTPQKLTFDEIFPDPSLVGTSDPTNDRIILGPYLEGLYELTISIAFECSSEIVYYLEVYADYGSGEQPTGGVIPIGTGNNQDEVSSSNTTLVKVTQPGALSIYYYMLTGTGLFNVHRAVMYVKRIA